MAESIHFGEEGSRYALKERVLRLHKHERNDPNCESPVGNEIINELENGISILS